jgi:hypothetical protein
MVDAEGVLWKAVTSVGRFAETPERGVTGS